MAEARTDDAPLAAAKQHQAEEARAQFGDAAGGTVIGRTVTINKPVAEVYRAFRDFGNLPRFMENVVSVEEKEGGTTHWVVKAPAGRTVEWDALLTDDTPDRLIAWRSAEGADVPNTGRVEFKDAGLRGTVVSAVITYDPPAGIVGKLIAKMFQREPAIQARRDLRRFKQWLETGEVATPARNQAEFEEMGL